MTELKHGRNNSLFVNTYLTLCEGTRFEETEQYTFFFPHETDEKKVVRQVKEILAGSPYYYTVEDIAETEIIVMGYNEERESEYDI